jgi:hypothetical protein
MDRRFSKSLPRLELDHTLTDRIISLALEYDIGEGSSGKSLNMYFVFML